MKIAVVHYHLRMGGVTRIIQNSTSISTELGISNLVLIGESCKVQDSTHLNVDTVEGLGYLSPNDRSLLPLDLVRNLESAAKKNLGSLPDVWHFHNHSLGKNVVLPQAIRIMAEKGYPILLQIHDFAEDGRAENYRILSDHLLVNCAGNIGKYLYPVATHIHYAALNGRDLNYMAKAGLPYAQLHLLPNPVTIDTTGMHRESQSSTELSNVVVYPSRAIRRKNIGELVFWAAVSNGDEQYAVTSAPQTQTYRIIYDQWVAFAKRLNLPIEFEICNVDNTNFLHIIKSARALVTTSIQEGFGLAFLEPWLLNQPLYGRKISDITTEFEEASVDLSSLYTRLDVPLTWIGRERCMKTFIQRYMEYSNAYGVAVEESDIENLIDIAINGDRIDFGRLDEAMQRDVINQIVDAPQTCKTEIYPRTVQTHISGDRIEKNHQAVKQNFNLDNYGVKLKNIYRQVLNSPAEAVRELDALRLLNQFLAPKNFYLLKA